MNNEESWPKLERSRLVAAAAGAVLLLSICQTGAIASAPLEGAISLSHYPDDGGGWNGESPPRASDGCEAVAASKRRTAWR